MKRDRDTPETQAITLVFFDQARDLLSRIVWDDVQTSETEGPLSRETYSRSPKERIGAIRRLRALMTTSRELNRVLVLNSQLWVDLMAVLAPQQGLRLRCYEFRCMNWSDLLQLYNKRIAPEVLVTALLGPTLSPALARLTDDTELLGLLGTRSPAEFEANVMRVVGTTLWHILSVNQVEWRQQQWLRDMAWDRWMAGRFYSVDRPLDWLLQATLQLAQDRDPDGTPFTPRGTEQSFEGPEYDVRRSSHLPYNYNHWGEYMDVKDWVPPMQRLVALWEQATQERQEAHLAFESRLRRDVQWAVAHLQQDDDAGTLVSKSELPMSYSLFWFALAYAGNGGRYTRYPREHRMFHACVGCEQPLHGECCWSRDEPNQLYCDAACYLDAGKNVPT